MTAKPDQAEVDVGVMTRASTARRAATDNAQNTARVLAEMKQRLGPAGTITTIGYSIHPEYRHPGEGREPQISGYVAVNTVRATTPELDGVGDLIDAALAAGANRVQRIQFTLKNDQPVYADALRQAATRARSAADALASALGLTIVRVLSVVEESAAIRPFADMLRTASVAESVATPVEPGTIDVHARVSLTVEVKR